MATDNTHTSLKPLYKETYSNTKKKSKKFTKLNKYLQKSTSK